MNNLKLNINHSTLLYSHFIIENVPQEIRIEKLSKVAISQMKILVTDINIKKYGDKND